MDVYKLNPMDSLFSPLSEYNNQLHSPPSFANAHPEIFYNEVQTEPDQLVSQLAIIQAHQQQIQSNQLLLNRQFQQQQQQVDDGPPGPSINNRKLGLYKTELCRSWEEKGTCRYGCKCQFAHGQDELRDVPRHPKFKTQLCATYWHSGSCPYGKRCCFIHSTFPHGANANGAPPLPLSEEEPAMTVSPRQSFTQTPTMHSLSLTPNTSTDSPPKSSQAEQYTPSLLSRIGERQRAGSTPSLSTSLDSNLSSPPPMSKTNSLNSFQFGEAPIYGLGLGFTNNKFDEFSLGFKNSL